MGFFGPSKKEKKALEDARLAKEKEEEDKAFRAQRQKQVLEDERRKNDLERERRSANMQRWRKGAEALRSKDTFEVAQIGDGVFGGMRVMNTILLGGEESPYQYTYTVELDRSEAISYMFEPNMFRDKVRVGKEHQMLQNNSKYNVNKSATRKSLTSSASTMGNKSLKPIAGTQTDDENADEENFYEEHPPSYLDPRDVILKQPGEAQGASAAAALSAAAVANAKNKSENKDHNNKSSTKSSLGVNRQQSTVFPDFDGINVGVPPAFQRITFKPRSALDEQNGQYYLGMSQNDYSAANDINAEDLTDRYFLKYEDWGIKLDISNYPITVKSIDYGSIADELSLGRPDFAVLQGDVLVEINDEPIVPTSMVWQYQRRQNLTVQEIRDIEDRSKEDPKSVGVAWNVPELVRDRFMLSTITRANSVATRFVYSTADIQGLKMADGLCQDPGLLNTRLDIINKELFDIYYHAPKVKLRFVRLAPPQIDRGLSYDYSCLLTRTRQVGSIPKKNWGIEFVLDWEVIPDNELNGRDGTGEDQDLINSEESSRDDPYYRGGKGGGGNKKKEKAISDKELKDKETQSKIVKKIKVETEKSKLPKGKFQATQNDKMKQKNIVDRNSQQSSTVQNRGDDDDDYSRSSDSRSPRSGSSRGSDSASSYTRSSGSSSYSSASSAANGPGRQKEGAHEFRNPKVTQDSSESNSNLGSKSQSFVSEVSGTEQTVSDSQSYSNYTNGRLSRQQQMIDNNLNNDLNDDMNLTSDSFYVREGRHKYRSPDHKTQSQVQNFEAKELRREAKRKEKIEKEKNKERMAKSINEKDKNLKNIGAKSFVVSECGPPPLPKFGGPKLQEQIPQEIQKQKNQDLQNQIQINLKQGGLSSFTSAASYSKQSSFASSMNSNSMTAKMSGPDTKLNRGSSSSNHSFGKSQQFISSVNTIPEGNSVTHSVTPSVSSGSTQRKPAKRMDLSVTTDEVEEEIEIEGNSISPVVSPSEDQIVEEEIEEEQQDLDDINKAQAQTPQESGSQPMAGPPQESRPSSATHSSSSSYTHSSEFSRSSRSYSSSSYTGTSASRTSRTSDHSSYTGTSRSSYTIVNDRKSSTQNQTEKSNINDRNNANERKPSPSQYSDKSSNYISVGDNDSESQNSRPQSHQSRNESVVSRSGSEFSLHSVDSGMKKDKEMVLDSKASSKLARGKFTVTNEASPIKPFLEGNHQKSPQNSSSDSDSEGGDDVEMGYNHNDRDTYQQYMDHLESGSQSQDSERPQSSEASNDLSQMSVRSEFTNNSAIQSNLNSNVSRDLISYQRHSNNNYNDIKVRKLPKESNVNNSKKHSISSSTTSSLSGNSMFKKHIHSKSSFPNQFQNQDMSIIVEGSHYMPNNSSVKKTQTDGGFGNDLEDYLMPTQAEIDRDRRQKEIQNEVHTESESGTPRISDNDSQGTVGPQDQQQQVQQQQSTQQKTQQSSSNNTQQPTQGNGQQQYVKLPDIHAKPNQNQNKVQDLSDLSPSDRKKALEKSYGSPDDVFSPAARVQDNYMEDNFGYLVDNSPIPSAAAGLGGEQGAGKGGNTMQEHMYRKLFLDNGDASPSSPGQQSSDVQSSSVNNNKLRLRRVIKVAGILPDSVASQWNQTDPDCAIRIGDKLMSINGMEVGNLDWDFLVLPPYPDDAELTTLEDENELMELNEQESTRHGHGDNGPQSSATMGGFTNLLPKIQEKLQSKEGGGGGQSDYNSKLRHLTDAEKRRALYLDKVAAWKQTINDRFYENKVLAQLFELVFDEIPLEELEYDQFGLPKRRYITFLKCRENYCRTQLELSLELRRYDANMDVDGSLMKTAESPTIKMRNLDKGGLRSPRRVLENIEQTDMDSPQKGLPIAPTQPDQHPFIDKALLPGSAEHRKEQDYIELDAQLNEEIMNFHPPPSIEMPTSLAKSRWKVSLTRIDTSLPWGIYLDERFAGLNIYCIQELEEFEDSPVAQWNEYMRKIGAFGAELRVGDLILSFNGINSWSGGSRPGDGDDPTGIIQQNHLDTSGLGGAEREVADSLKLILECYRPPFKPCAMTSAPYLSTNEKEMQISWAKSRFLTSVYQDEDLLANTPEGGFRDTHYCIVLHCLSPDRWYIVDGESREAKDITCVVTAIPAPILSLQIVNLVPLRSYEAYVAIRNTQGWSPFSKVSNREMLEKFIQLKISTKKLDKYKNLKRYVCVTNDSGVPMYEEPMSQPLPNQTVKPGDIVQASKTKDGLFLKMEKLRGGLHWCRYSAAEHFISESKLYRKQRLLCMAPTSFETLEGRYPVDAPRSIEVQPLPVSFKKLDAQLVTEHFSTLEEWREYYQQQAKKKEEERKAKMVANLLGTTDHINAQNERAHKEASLGFFRIADLVEEVENRIPEGHGHGCSSNDRQMAKKRVEVSPERKEDNITTFKAVLKRRVPQEAWGFHFDKRLETAGQKVIRTVDMKSSIPNVLQRWNRAQQERKTPYLEIRIGDRLLTCNGKTSIFAIAEQLEKSMIINCEFCRAGETGRQLPDYHYSRGIGFDGGKGPEIDDIGRIQNERSIRIFNSEVMLEPHRVIFTDFNPLGIALDFRRGWPLRVKYVGRLTSGQKLGVQQGDIVDSINSVVVEPRHVITEQHARAQIEPALEQRPLELVLKRGMAFSLRKYDPSQIADKKIKKFTKTIVLPEGHHLGFSWDIDQWPPPIRHVKPFSKAMKLGVHIADAIKLVNGVKVTSAMVKNAETESSSGNNNQEIINAQNTANMTAGEAAALAVKQMSKTQTTGTASVQTQLEKMLSVRPVEIVFERGLYEPPYPDHFTISECGFGFDPTLTVDFKFYGANSNSLPYIYDPNRDILPRVENPSRNLLGRGLRRNDLILGVNGTLFYDFKDWNNHFPTELYRGGEVKVRFLLSNFEQKLVIYVLRVQSVWRGVIQRRKFESYKRRKAIESKFAEQAKKKMKLENRTEEEIAQIKDDAGKTIQSTFRQKKAAAEKAKSERQHALDRAIKAGEIGLRDAGLGYLNPETGEFLDPDEVEGLSPLNKDAESKDTFEMKLKNDEFIINYGMRGEGRPHLPEDAELSESEWTASSSSNTSDIGSFSGGPPSSGTSGNKDVKDKTQMSQEKLLRKRIRVATTQLRRAPDELWSTYECRVEKKKNERWGLSFDQDIGVVLTVHPDSVLARPDSLVKTKEAQDFSQTSGLGEDGSPTGKGGLKSNPSSPGKKKDASSSAVWGVKDSSSKQGPEKVRPGDVILSVNGCYDPSKFIAFMSTKSRLDLVFKRLEDPLLHPTMQQKYQGGPTDQSPFAMLNTANAISKKHTEAQKKFMKSRPRIPFSVLLERNKSAGETWGLQLDQANGMIIDIVANKIADDYNNQKQREGNEREMILEDDRVMCINGEPLVPSELARLAGGSEVDIFILPAGFDSLVEDMRRVEAPIDSDYNKKMNTRAIKLNDDKSDQSQSQSQSYSKSGSGSSGANAAGSAGDGGANKKSNSKGSYSQSESGSGSRSNYSSSASGSYSRSGSSYSKSSSRTPSDIQR